MFQLYSDLLLAAKFYCIHNFFYEFKSSPEPPLIVSASGRSPPRTFIGMPLKQLVTPFRLTLFRRHLIKQYCGEFGRLKAFGNVVIPIGQCVNVLCHLTVFFAKRGCSTQGKFVSLCRF